MAAVLLSFSPFPPRNERLIDWYKGSQNLIFRKRNRSMWGWNRSAISRIVIPLAPPIVSCRWWKVVTEHSRMCEIPQLSAPNFRPCDLFVESITVHLGALLFFFFITITFWLIIIFFERNGILIESHTWSPRMNLIMLNSKESDRE